MGDDWLASRIVGRCHVIGLEAPAGPWWSTEGRQGVGLEHGITINHGHDGRSVFERHGVSVSGCAPPLPGREQSDLSDHTRGCPVCEIGHPSWATNRPIGGGSLRSRAFSIWVQRMRKRSYRSGGKWPDGAKSQAGMLRNRGWRYFALHSGPERACDGYHERAVSRRDHHGSDGRSEPMNLDVNYSPERAVSERDHGHSRDQKQERD